MTNRTALRTRIHQVNVSFVPRVLASLILRPLPTDYCKRVLESLWSFIWQGNTRRVPQEYLTQPERVGGLGLSPPETMLNAEMGAVMVRWLPVRFLPSEPVPVLARKDGRLRRVSLLAWCLSPWERPGR